MQLRDLRLISKLKKPIACLAVLISLSVLLFFQNPDLVCAKTGDSTPADQLEIKIGYSGGPYTSVHTFQRSELEALPQVQQAYSFIDSLPCPVIDSAVGVKLTDILAACNIDAANVSNFRFWTTDIQGVPYETLTKTYLLDTPRYYFPHLGDNWNTDNDAGEICFPDPAAAAADAVEVSAILAIRDNWQRELTGSLQPDFTTLSDSNRFRLVFGKTDDLAATVPEHTASKSAKWVTEIDVTLNTTAVTGVALDAATANLTVGDVRQLTATVSPANATNRSVTWASDNNNVATVDNDGRVTANAAGTAEITVTTAEGGLTASCEVTVSNPIPPLLTPPALTASANTVGQDVTLSFTDDPAWRAAIGGITVDGLALTTEQYTVTAGSIKIVAGAMNRAGNHTIVVRAAGYTDASVIQVITAPVVTLSSIAITTPATKLVYAVGEPLDLTGLVVTGTYSDGSTRVEPITVANVTGFDSSSAMADQVLTITVGSVSTTYKVTINPIPPLLTPPELTASANNPVGQDVTLTFTDDPAWRAAIGGITIDGLALTTKQYTVTAGSINIVAQIMDTAGNHTIVVQAAGYTDASVIQVITAPVTLSSIAITTPATKLIYTVGEPLDLTGLVVTGTYSDGSTRVEPITIANVTGFDSSSAKADQVLTITVGTATTTYKVRIVAVPEPGPQITGLVLKSKSSSEIDLSWNKFDGVKLYTIYRAASAEGTFSKIGSVKTLSFKNKKLLPSTGYWYKVTATTAEGESIVSEIKTAATQALVPGSLKVSNVTSASITLNWKEAAGSTFNVYRSTARKGIYTLIEQGLTTASYTDQDIPPGTVYWYKVTASNPAGDESAASSMVSAATKLLAPSTLKASAVSKSEIDLSWDQVTSAKSYNIYLAKSADGIYKKIGNSRTTDCRNKSGLKPGTTYWYKVTAVAATGEGESSEAVMAATLPAVK